MNGADLLVAELQARGVRWISTLCGHGLDPLFGACRRAGVRLVDTRNEQAAAYMAECFGRLTRQVGVCAVSSGVAHANALTGVLNARFDGAPMLLISGAGALETAGKGHFQDMDQVGLAAPICKYARLVTAARRIPEFVHEAFAAALSGRPGPVHLTVPLDVLTASVEEPRAEPHRGVIIQPARMAPDAEAVAAAAELIGEAQRPLLVAGSGVYYARAEAVLSAFAGTHSVPVLVPIWDRGAVLDPIPQFMGVLGAASGGPRLLPDADLILVLGAASDYRVGYLQPPALAPDARVVRVDVDSERLHAGPAPDLAVQGDPGLFLTQLHGALSERGVPPFAAWLSEAQRRRDAWRAEMMPTDRPAGVHPADILAALRETLTGDTVLVVDGGCIGQWFHQLLCDRYPGRYLTCGASGVVGFGIPGAMAARLAYPDRPAILLSGDGSMTFTIAELESAARQGLSFVAVVADDQSWGIVEAGHRQQFGEPISCVLGPIQFDAVAEAFGARGVRADRPDAIAPAIREGLCADRPTVIHVPVTNSMPGRRQ